MSKILEDLLGKDAGGWTLADIINKFKELEKRIDVLEEKNRYGGVYLDGASNIVKDYYNDLIEKQKEVSSK